MYGIRTTYHGPTATRGGRITATANGARLTIGYPHHVGEGEAAHRIAAERLAAKLGWPGGDPADSAHLYGGAIGPDAYAFTIGPSVPALLDRIAATLQDARTVWPVTEALALIALERDMHGGREYDAREGGR